MASTTPSRIHPTIALGSCGAGTGVINWLIYVSDSEFASEFLGLIFGFVVAVCLYYLYRLTAARMVVVFLLFGLSWQMAIRFAFETYDYFNNMMVVGIFSGAIGAFVLAAGFAALYPQFRRPSHIMRTITIGAVAGMILGVKPDFGAIALFVVWQASVAASLGYERAVFET